MDNHTIAQRLLDYAAELERGGHNLYRVRAYRKAATTVRWLARPLIELLEEGGREALAVLPGIGDHLAYTLEELLHTGEFRTLGPRFAASAAGDELTSLPGVGPRLAQRLREELGVSTVEEVTQAARDGRLEMLALGPKRLRGLLDSLQAREKPEAVAETLEPTVAELLAVDEEFRAHTGRGLRLRRPDDERTGPSANVLQTRRGAWNFHATFSDTPLAHRLGLTRDWVVIHFDNGQVSGERTVVTETRNHLIGQRVVRGRERECQACWAS